MARLPGSGGHLLEPHRQLISSQLLERFLKLDSRAALRLGARRALDPHIPVRGSLATCAAALRCARSGLSKDRCLILYSSSSTSFPGSVTMPVQRL